MNDTSARLMYIDVLRGFALFGILIVNIWFFADSYFGSDQTNPLFQRDIDVAVRFVNALIFEAKFYLLFSFLFGYSFYLQFESAKRSGANFVKCMMRRLLGLLLIGLLHACLLFDAEILSLYAYCGLLLFFLRKKSIRSMRSFAILLICFSALIWFLLAQAVEIEPELHGDIERLHAYRAGAWATLNFHVASLPAMFGNLLILQAPTVLAMFCLGYCCARDKYLEQAMESFSNLRSQFTPWLFRLLPLALISASFYALSSQIDRFDYARIWSYGLQQLTAPVMSATYLFLLLVWIAKVPKAKLLQKMAYAGKFALSNYLIQSLVFGFLFTGYGFSQIDQLAPWQIYLVAILLYSVQLHVSYCWGQYFRYGPAEFVLRAITLWRLPKFRIV